MILDEPIAPEPQGDIAHDRVAAHRFNQAVRQYVLARLRQEWGKHPRSLTACVRMLWASWLNLSATLRLWMADTLDQWGSVDKTK